MSSTTPLLPERLFCEYPIGTLVTLMALFALFRVMVFNVDKLARYAEACQVSCYHFTQVIFMLLVVNYEWISFPGKGVEEHSPGIGFFESVILFVLWRLVFIPLCIRRGLSSYIQGSFAIMLLTCGYVFLSDNGFNVQNIALMSTVLAFIMWAMIKISSARSDTDS
ncbi:hypothetical protein [Candidatus Synchoanobacter obligatus]|uniref:Uncharacterized protein n=1 Tax=Candidatus Synchoanobacter obligatus TaxID=2919597 RepID=A0ABT1L3Y8_9GAMM|nr:hypothetical protein [Candidatus Synchoanobacter obligatus]MCP8351895.1 hypothetical protein [Candidatus Synchoanobacter obligatus]